MQLHNSKHKYGNNNEFTINIVISISEFINNNSLVDSLFSLDKNRDLVELTVDEVDAIVDVSRIVSSKM